MKLYLLPLLCSAVLAGCQSQKPSTGANPSSGQSTADSASSQAPAQGTKSADTASTKTFTESQMVGKYLAEASFSPGFPNAKKDMIMKVISGTYLQLKPKNRFALGGPKSTMSGVWGIRAQQLYLTATEKNGIPIDKVIQQLVAKGANPKQVGHIKDPAMFRISDDGLQLMSPTPTPDVTVVLKKSL